MLLALPAAWVLRGPGPTPAVGAAPASVSLPVSEAVRRLGGQVLGATGNHDWAWCIDTVLAVGAALIHLPIREAAVVRPRSA